MAKRSLFINNRPQKGLIAWIGKHWQFVLTFIVACIGSWLLVNQNDLLENQNALIQRQMSLEEASRRSALVMLMSNIMDKVDDEIKEQKSELRSKGISKVAVDTMKFSLSQSLVGQIAALSHSFKPYRFMNEDTLIKRPLSPERGQLLATLSSLPLDSITFRKIYAYSTFSEADLGNAFLWQANLIGADLRRANLSNASFSQSDLSDSNLFDADMSMAFLRGAKLKRAELGGVDLSGAQLDRADLRWAHLGKVNLMWANLCGANLKWVTVTSTNWFGTYLIDADLSGADLSGADLKEAYLSGAFFSGSNLGGADLSLEQASSLKTLQGCKGLADSISMPLHKSHPQLFMPPNKPL